MQFREGPVDLGLMLGRVGLLEDRKDWVEQGIKAAQKAMADGRKRVDYDGTQNITALAGLLAETGRGAEAETLLTEAIATAVRDGQNEQTRMMYDNQNAARMYLIALAQLYARAGRDADVLVLLDDAPQWGVKDLAEIYQESGSLAMFHPHQVGGQGSLGYLAAVALAKAGHKDEARKIVDALLDHDGGFDPAYELLLQLGDTNMPALMDKMFARDQFEERPLIWKAHWLREAGKLEEAEAAARHAISVDPSDGEQGPGNRMRAYSELADVREARGDKKQAEFFRGAVTAIRMSEQADRFYEAGLLSRAVKMYEESLNHFADAYCIQSRLALRLSELGLHEQAEAHYRRAYELMPESFGRVESHCFGCEGVFHGEQAQNLAEKVFGELAIKTPDKPQVHYLLGYLREEQGRYQDALPEFQKAVKLDTDYLNAWKHLQSIETELHLPAADRDAVTLNLLRLDPLGRHDRPEFSSMSDLRALWQAVEAAQKFETATPTALYPLAASKAALDTKPKTSASPREMMMMNRYVEMSREGQKLTPARAISGQYVISLTIGLLGGNGAMSYLNY